MRRLCSVLYLSPVAVCLSNCVCLSLQISLPSNSGSVLPSSGKHPCSLCGRSFSRNYILRRHEAAHSGSYACWCEICGKGSVNSSNLRRHMLTHSNKAEHKCTVCNLSFRYESSLKRHFEHCHSDLSLESQLSHYNSLM